MPYPATPEDVNNVPVSAVYVPGTGWVALQGVTITTDGLGNQSALVSVKDTNSSAILAALGAIGDSAWSGSGNGSEIAVLKKIAGNQSGPYTVTFQGAQPVEGTYTELTGSASALNADLLASMDVSMYKYVTIGISGTYSGTVSFQQSLDNVNFDPISLNFTNTSTSANQQISSTTTTNRVHGPLLLRWLRIRMTSYSSGTANLTLGLYTVPPPLMFNTLNVIQSSSGVPFVVVNDNYTPFNISTATTTTVRSVAGHIRSIRVLGGTLGNVTIYDSTSASGTVLVPTMTPVANQVLLEDVAFSNGLTIVTAAATIIAGGWR